jgi:hypothetical protein
MLMDKRIAICFSGQVRHLDLFENYYNRWNDKVENKNFKFDFFISAWDDFANKSVFKDFTRTRFIKLEDRLEKYKLEHLSNGAKMSNLMSDVALLKRHYELKNNFVYDYVIQTRPDEYISFSDIIQHLERVLRDDDTILENRYALFTSSVGLQNDQGRIRLIVMDDNVCAGMSETLDLYLMMTKYIDINNHDNQYNMKNFSHSINAYWMRYLNLIIKEIKVSSSIIRGVHDINFIRGRLEKDKNFVFLNNFTDYVRSERQNWDLVRDDEYEHLGNWVMKHKKNKNKVVSFRGRSEF